MPLSRALIEAILQASGGALGAELWDAGDLEEVLSATVDEPVSARFSGVGATLLQLASFAPERPDCARLLLGAGAELDAHSAAGLGLVDDLARLLTEDPKLRDRWIDAFSPLHYAIASDQAESVRCLIAREVDPNAAIDRVGWFTWEDEAVSSGLACWRPVHMAALHGSVSALQALVAGGASLAPRCLFGTGVMHLAAMADGVPMLAALAALGADVNDRAEAYPEAVNLLMGDQAVSFAQIVGVSGRTPLMVAAAEGHYEASRMLLELGADTACVDSAGRTAAQYAMHGFYGSHRKIVRLIQDA